MWNLFNPVGFRSRFSNPCLIYIFMCENKESWFLNFLKLETHKIDERRFHGQCQLRWSFTPPFFKFPNGSLHDNTTRSLNHHTVISLSWNWTIRLYDAFVVTLLWCMVLVADLRKGPRGFLSNWLERLTNFKSECELIRRRRLYLRRGGDASYAPSRYKLTSSKQKKTKKKPGKFSLEMGEEIRSITSIWRSSKVTDVDISLCPVSVFP